MSEPLSRDAESLEGLRREIDAVDAEMHRLLMRRGELIERLIAAKRSAPAGSAFRPDREADMLARLSARHQGALPLASVEHIWREIIGTFTQLQAPFRVHAVSAGAPTMRDLLRFHFGFATPLVDQPSPLAVIAGLRAEPADLGVVPLDAAAGPVWWRELSTAPGGVKATAILPFLTAAEGWPVSLVLGSAATVNPAADLGLFAATVEGAAAPGRLNEDLEILAAAGPELLIACRGGEQSLAAAAREVGLAISRLQPAGEYCAPLLEQRSRK